MTIERGSERTNRRTEGYSLSELLAVIALLGLFILFGGPAMADAFRAYKVRSSADIVATDVRAMRYSAVGQRSPRTMTINSQGSGTNANSYSFVNAVGTTITRRMDGVNIEDASADTLSFSTTGATGSAGTEVIILSMTINGSRGDRYTISISPSGTVSAAYSTYTP